MKIKKGVLTQKLGDKYLAYDNQTSTLHELNETAYVILELLSKGKNKKNIVLDLIKRYGIGHERSSKDFDEFVEELRKKELIVAK